MAAPRVLVLRSPGTNCDEETAHAFEIAGGIGERVHVERLIENPALSGRYQILCLPGGFSYGDDIAAGRVLANQLKHRLSDLLDYFRENDRLVLGICNGFQVLMRLGLLTEGIQPCPAATLSWNDHGRFEDRWVHLDIEDDHQCIFLNGLHRLFLPVAHAEGKFTAASVNALAQMQSEGRLVLRYTSRDSTQRSDSQLPFPCNPNGSQANVAGMCDKSGRLFGLMPHPERYVHRTHHPHWTRLDTFEKEKSGLAIFANAVRYFSS